LLENEEASKIDEGTNYKKLNKCFQSIECKTK